MNFNELFKSKKPVIGMIHLSGDNKINQAIEELLIYEKCKVDGVILENYHGTTKDVCSLIESIENCHYDLTFGVNVLGNYKQSFKIAKNNNFIKFIQIDAISGQYEFSYPDYDEYDLIKSKSCAIVLGGVWPKYYTPVKGSDLKKDLIDAKKRCEAVVVTGKATGSETPLTKIFEFGEILENFPLIIGAGINDKNVLTQLKFADACIIGSYFKDNKTESAVNEEKVKKIMDLIKNNF